MPEEKTAMSLFKIRQIPQRNQTQNKKRHYHPVKNKIYYWSGRGRKSILLQSNRFDIYQGKKIKRGYLYFNILSLKNGLQFQATFIVFIKDHLRSRKQTYHLFTPIPIQLLVNMHTIATMLPPEFQKNRLTSYQYYPNAKFMIPNKEYYMQSGYKDLLQGLIDKKLIIEWNESHPIQRKKLLVTQKVSSDDEGKQEDN